MSLIETQSHFLHDLKRLTKLHGKAMIYDIIIIRTTQDYSDVALPSYIY
jgi:glutamate-1-semialdehyde aminotransferase